MYVFRTLLEMGLPGLCRSQHLSDLLHRCLTPLLHILADHPYGGGSNGKDSSDGGVRGNGGSSGGRSSNGGSDGSTQGQGQGSGLDLDPLMVSGKAWALLGLLRLHLVLPRSPVDPATQPAVKVID